MSVYLWSRSRIADQEALFLTAWPADETLHVDGWMLRATQGVSHRANSVFPDGWTGQDVERTISQAEEFYAERGLPCVFLMAPSHEPSDLDARLAARGYTLRKETRVCMAQPKTVSAIGRLHEEAFTIDFLSDQSAEWMETYCADGDHADLRGRTEIMARVAPPRVFILVRSGRTPVGLGMGVLRDRMAIIQGMRTVMMHRDHGIGRHGMAALGRWAAAIQAERMALQVEAGNPAANRLYEGAGFREIYRYGYRVRP